MVSWTPGPDRGEALLKIGEVAEQVGLSLRTIRFYEEEGLVLPETRTAGGFRLYSVTAVNRLELIKRMKPLGFTVEEMVEVLTDLDTLEAATTAPQERAVLTARLDACRQRVEARSADLVAKAARGREFGHHLREVNDRHGARSARPQHDGHLNIIPAGRRGPELS
jgi:DNA-binding transcriptional MerR regulator